MTQMPSPNAENADQIDQQAAMWFTRRHGQRMSEDDNRQFEQWLNASTEHAQAYDAIAAVWREFAAMPRPASAQAAEKKRPFFSLWRGLGHTAAALFIAAILFLPYSHLPALLLNNMTLVATDAPKEVTLPDGSQLFLNSQTRIRVAYETEVRHLYLDEGSVYFKVKANPYRPFVIEADGRRIQVVGTEFEVRQQQHQVAVMVSQGVVRFQNDEQDKNQYLVAGEQLLSAGPKGPITLTKIAPQDVARWRFGELIFTDKPLDELLAELKPYSSLQVELSPPALGKSLLSGRINLDKPEAFFQALPALLPVEVIYKDKNNLLIINNKKGK